MKSKIFISILSTLGFTAITERFMGRIYICKCGYIKLWHGVINTSQNSQHLTDWYTFSHIIHGFVFYYLSKKLLPKTSLLQAFIISLIVESAWEILENSSFIINRYRTATISLDYFGDSIINSCFDILAMTLGFYLAKKLPTWTTITLTIFLELLSLWFIRDNLFLNIVMLVYPLSAIKIWQSGI